MNIESDVIDLAAKFAAVNAVAALLLAVMSFVLSAFMLNRLAAFDRWLDPSRPMGDISPRLDDAPPVPAREPGP